MELVIGSFKDALEAVDAADAVRITGFKGDISIIGRREPKAFEEGGFVRTSHIVVLIRCDEKERDKIADHLKQKGARRIKCLSRI